MRRNEGRVRLHDPGAVEVCVRERERVLLALLWRDAGLAKSR